MIHYVAHVEYHRCLGAKRLLDICDQLSALTPGFNQVVTFEHCLFCTSLIPYVRCTICLHIAYISQMSWCLTVP